MNISNFVKIAALDKLLNTMVHFSMIGHIKFTLLNTFFFE